VISVLLPSRGRPDNIRRLLDSITATASDLANIEVIVRLDSDDATFREYIVQRSAVGVGLSVQYLVGPRIVLSECWNDCYRVARGDILMQCGDDIIFRTPGWDETVEQTFNEYPDRILFAYGDDGIQGRGFGTHGFISREWVEAVGYFVPPYFVSDFNDTWLNEVSEMIGRHRWIDIYTEHLHFVVGKAEIDQTHQDRIDRHEAERPQDLYASLYRERILDAGKLQRVMEN